MTDPLEADWKPPWRRTEPTPSQIDAELDAENERGEAMHFRVVRVNDAEITVDGNHPLAGQDITFIVRVTDVRDATPAELAANAQQQIH